MRIGQFADGDKEASRWRVTRRDTCKDLPGTVVVADDETGEVIMREAGYERLTDEKGNPKKDASGNEIWNPRLRKYIFLHGAIKIQRK